VYVLDRGNQAIRKIDPAGVVTTVAGTIGQVGSTDGTGTAAQFRNAFAIAAGVDVNGQDVIYVADRDNGTIRKITKGTQGWLVSTVVGLAGENGIRLGKDGRLLNPVGVASIGPSRLAITSGRAVLIEDLP
jgi:hypothetical protein